ncbi:alpha/beta hydrolase-fold protein [Corynebacterium sp. KPL2680]|uniref:alpha/beta hydrolase-fold protein n=1 Tax=Corynebacterium sp. KPL2680 TaxID=3158310 RepID=UPI0032F02FD0
MLRALERGDVFLTKELLPWAQRFSPVLLPAQRIIAGASLGDFFAAGTVHRIPEVVSHAIVQSAALWWPDHGMAELRA